MRAELAPGLSGGLQLEISSCEDPLVSALKPVSWWDVADRAVEAVLVVVIDESCDDVAPIVEAQRCSWPDALALQGPVVALDLAVGLGVVGRSLDVTDTDGTDEGLEVSGDELGSVVADDAGLDAWEGLQGAL